MITPNLDVSGIRNALKAVEASLGIESAASTAKNIIALIESEYKGIEYDDNGCKASKLCIDMLERCAEYRALHKSIEPGKYRHYKGTEYHVLNTVIHSETHEFMVIYQEDVVEAPIWCRPIKMFHELVEINGNKIPRFVKVEQKI